MSPQVTLIFPCRNEELALPRCLEGAAASLRASGLAGEIVVVNNGSTDRSAKILAASRHLYPELVVVEEPRPGYGFAYRRGFAAARGEIVLMADCDGTYDLADLPRFAAAIRDGAALAIGDRFATPMAQGAMPLLRRVGNPILSGLARLLYGVPVRDVHCGLRAASREALRALNLRSTGMELASEMIVEAARRGMKLVELPTSYAPRLGESKLRAFPDGWRHVRFLFGRLPRALARPFAAETR